jgi:uncharacterized protein (DUF2236 family)
MGVSSASDLGFYGPESLSWRLGRERVMLLGGPRALLLQVAHPLVAAGVAEFSSFRSDPLLRLRRTLDSTLALIFGTRAEAEKAVERINGAHAQVHGVLPERAGRYEAGTPYDATDPELLLWVHATLVDTTFTVYTRFVAPLTADELEGAYEESKVAARLLGVPDDLIPPTADAFAAYFDVVVLSDRLAGAPFQRSIVRDVLYPPLGRVPKSVYWPSVALTAALLPPRVRELFAIEQTPVRRRFAGVTQRLVRGILPVVPQALRDMPQARHASRRVASAK